MSGSTPYRSPTLAFLFSHPAHFIACGLGSGLSRYAPGTAGTCFAWLSYPLVRFVYADDMQFLLFLLLMLLFGFWCCHVTGKHLGELDHGSIVWDEIVAFWAVLLFTPHELPWQLCAFLLFRFFDIVKLPPADFFDQRMKNGFGVMMDDLICALFATVVVAIAKRVMV